MRMYYIIMSCSLETALIQIDYAKSVACPPSWRWDSLGQQWCGLHLWVVAGGRGHLVMPDAEHELSRGECFVLRTMERHIGTHDPKRPLLVHTSTFRLVDPSTGECWYPSDDELPRHRTVGEFQFFESLVLRYISAWERRGSASANAPRSWLTAVLDEFRRPEESPDGNESRRSILRLADGIKADPGGDHSLRALSKRLHRSENQTIRLFKRFTGNSPGALLQTSRMEMARTLLLYSSLSVKEIAGRLGYCDQFAFSNSFKAATGGSPSDFRFKNSEARVKRSA